MRNQRNSASAGVHAAECGERPGPRRSAAAACDHSHYASRNAAFQNAVTIASGIPLAPDGDLLRYERGEPVAEPGSTELATRTLARRLDMNASRIRRGLSRGRTYDFERSRLYSRVFALADKVSGKPVPRALLPRIVLQSPKITRKLTTDWFATRVHERHKKCLARGAQT